MASDLDALQPLLGPPGSTSEKGMYAGRRLSASHESPDFPMPAWLWARKDKHGRKLPQTISHRGYKAKHPENTMASFQGAVAAGTHAIETDIHLSKDNVVVLSHDPDLKRCYGEKDKIIDCSWSYLSNIRTLKEPHEPMPRLADLLEYLSQPHLSHLWVLLDIKLDNDAPTVMHLIAQTINSVEPSPDRPWSDRIVLGVWAAKYLPLCTEELPGFPISHIGFSTCYARQFISVPNTSFNMLQKVLFGPIGASFIRDVKKAGRPIYDWTVNDANLMKWSIQKELDGVITDDPKMFNEICDNWSFDAEPTAWITLMQWLYAFWLYMIIMVFSIPFRRRFPETVKDYLKDKRRRATLKLGA